MKNFVEELRWRGLIHDMIPGAEEEMLKEAQKAYIGFDPTADSLHVGSLVPIMILVHLQEAGHQPIALVGGATGMIGDPSGKSAERNLLSEADIQKNVEGIKNQLESFLKFEGVENPALMVNNYDWFKDFNILDFLRDVGKHLTINYMMAKESVKKRVETGLSFTEFSYQLIQGYDFFHLNKEYGCRFQLGGSDQWGNIVTGTEFIRRMGGTPSFAITSPLLTKSDGTKFGKSEGGNVWLDPKRTSPYKFYQFWLNADDDDAKRYIKIFTLKGQEEIEKLIAQHDEAPHNRLLQKTIGENITIRVHGKEAYEKAIESAAILFGKNTQDQLKTLDEQSIRDVFEGVPQFDVAYGELENPVEITELLATYTQIASSKGDARRSLKGNAISVNKVKINDSFEVSKEDLIQDRYLIVQKGKKNYYLVSFEK
ncbi:MAG: tyrosine--tRNA ligase [Flavobacteriales bacterium]|jgi:tyrosyl-tRNA synthetase|nr:tyrosine--tRNA ligase [Flavobacteriales bacterium]